MYHWYQDSDGKYLGQSDLRKNFPDPLPAGTSIIDILPKELREGIWNTVTRTFDPRPNVRNIDKLDFLDLFTAAELEGILSSSNIKVKVFVKKLEMAPNTIRLTSQRMITAVNGLESLGIIAAGRASEILNG